MVIDFDFEHELTDLHLQFARMYEAQVRDKIIALISGVIDQEKRLAKQHQGFTAKRMRLERIAALEHIRTEIKNLPVPERVEFEGL